MSREEFPALQVSVSILCNFEDGADFTDWELGTHGIRIEFVSERGNKKTATFLPEVPTAQGWDKIQTIDSLLRKGGWRGQVTPDVRRQIRLVRYQSELVSVSYQDYLHHCRSRSQGEHWPELCSTVQSLPQVQYSTMQYSTRLPPEYRPPAYCSAPGHALCPPNCHALPYQPHPPHHQ